jgi:hypothetical protein
MTALGVEEQRSHGGSVDPTVDVVAGGSEMTGCVPVAVVSDVH